MSEEYIKKDDILNELEYAENFFRDGSKKYQDTDNERATIYKAVANVYKYLILFTKGLPTYSVPEREKGEWRPIYQGDEIIDYRCTKCEFGSTFGKSTYNMHFCPNCGADMRGGKE